MVTGEERIHRAVLYRERRGPRYVLAKMLERSDEQAELRGEIVLPRHLALVGLEDVHARRRLERGQVVETRADGEIAAPLARKLVSRERRYGGEVLVQSLVESPRRGVELLLAFAVEHAQADLVLAAEAARELARDVHVAKAVGVGIEARRSGIAHGGDAGSGDRAGLEREARAAVLVAVARAELSGVVGAVSREGIGAGIAAAAAREDLHHAADGVGAVEAGGGSAQHLDALDLLERQLLDGGETGRGRAHAHAVDEEQRVAGVRAAQEHLRGSAEAAVLRHLHARDGLQHIGERALARAIDVFARHDGNVVHQLGEALRRARRGDDHHVVLRY